MMTKAVAMMTTMAINGGLNSTGNLDGDEEEDGKDGGVFVVVVVDDEEEDVDEEGRKTAV